MADTFQAVSWSLELKCALRTGQQWFLPAQTGKQLVDLRTVAAAEGENRNVAGICVTAWTTECDNSGNSHDIPDSGFRIEQQLGPVGGLPAALDLCGTCVANAKTELAIDVAGCFGSLRVWPDSEEFEAELWRIIDERNLESRLRAAFPVTTPLWYGFWIHSPLRRLQAEVLFELLEAACDHDDPEDEDVRHFLQALTAAIQWELPVHVSLSPLGHVDMGWHTVFPHCPRCKANAHVGRWEEHYQTTPHVCHVCGHSFVPDEHHSQERFDMDWESESLEVQLGNEGYEQFVRTFLLHQGCSEEQIDEIVDNKNQGPILRRIEQTRGQRDATIRRLRKKAVPKSPGELETAITISLSDDVDLELVLVPAGEFLMGSADSEDSPSESPQHVVRFQNPFYIGRYPVTQAQWTAVMGSNPSKHQGDGRLPVDQVSWFGCQDFCERLCQQQQRVFRLPSEAEWEYACRAGTTTRYAFGDSLSVEQANFTPMAVRMGIVPDSAESAIRELEKLAENRTPRDQKPTPVGSYPPNAWGIYDMHGNVEEWCDDVWHQGYVGAPADGTAWLDTEKSEPFRVMRGGWAAATELVCTSTSRRQQRSNAGEVADKDDDDSEIGADESEFLGALIDMLYIPSGFRVVCEISP